MTGALLIMFLVDLKNCVQKADIESFGDPRLQGDYDVESMWRVADIALACVQRNPDERPDMTEVARNLETVEARARERLQETTQYTTISPFSNYSVTSSLVSCERP